jgi:hypothetical protein
MNVRIILINAITVLSLCGALADWLRNVEAKLFQVDAHVISHDSRLDKAGAPSPD